MSNFSYERTITHQFSAKGELQADGDTVIVTDKDDIYKISVKEYLSKFIGKNISISVKLQAKNNLSDENTNSEAN